MKDIIKGNDDTVDKITETGGRNVRAHDDGGRGNRAALRVLLKRGGSVSPLFENDFG